MTLPVVFASVSLLAKWSGKCATTEWRPRDRPNTKHLECREHFPLFFTVQKTVVVLHRGEWRKLVRDRVVCFKARERPFRIHIRLLILTLHGLDYESKRECRHTLSGEKLTLICPTRTHSDVADVTRLDHIMQGLHLDQSRL